MHSAFFSIFEKYQSIFAKGCMLHFSGGKDAVCCLHVLVKKYNIIPKLCYWNLNPFLLRVNKEPLEYYSQLYKTDYTIVPHHDLICDIARKKGKRKPVLAEWLIKLYFDQGELPQIFGIKESDNLTAKLICNKGARENLHRYYPIYRWRNDHVLRYLEDEGIPLTQGYKNGYRDINEINTREVMGYIKEKYPDDYSKLVKLEPWRVSLER